MENKIVEVNQETLRTEAMAVWAIIGSMSSIFGNLLIMHLNTLPEVIKWYGLCFAIATMPMFFWFKLRGGKLK